MGMQIQVLYFAVFRERLGTSAETLELEPPATIADAIAALETRHPAVAALRGHYRVAHNQDFADVSTPLVEGDELALIPPVAGGADAPYARVLAATLSLDRCLDAVRSVEAGGLVTFTGMVRRHSRGHVIDHLEYEAYGEMAVKEMVRLIAELEAAAAPHRAEAFTACRAMIDRLKERVPIWKKEVGTGGEEWIGLGP